MLVSIELEVPRSHFYRKSCIIFDHQKDLQQIISLVEELDATICLLDHDLGFCVGVKHISMSNKIVSWLLYITDISQYQDWMSLGATLYYEENNLSTIIKDMKDISKRIVEEIP